MGILVVCCDLAKTAASNRTKELKEDGEDPANVKVAEHQHLNDPPHKVGHHKPIVDRAPDLMGTASGEADSEVGVNHGAIGTP